MKIFFNERENARRYAKKYGGKVYSVSPFFMKRNRINSEYVVKFPEGKKLEGLAKLPPKKKGNSNLGIAKVPAHIRLG